MAVSLLVAGTGLFVFTIYYTVQWLLRCRRRHMMAKQNGCLPPKKLSQIDPFLGTDVVLQNLGAAKKYGFLNLLRNRHAANGLTFTTNTYFRTTINTCDPTLIQNVLSFQFQDFGMGPLRRKSASPLLGRGIFTTDDDIWAHQRALIRPSFVRAQVTDFSIFGHHVDQLIGLIGRRNNEVDLQQLFFRMVCNTLAQNLPFRSLTAANHVRQVLDSNSEYMFGESVGLMSENASESATTFHHALDYAQQGTILRLRLGNLMFAHRDKKFRDSCDIVHAYADKFVSQALEFRRNQNSLPAEKKVMDEGARQKYVFLNELAKDTDDPILLRDQIVNMLLAARDTTAGLLAFVFFMLARRPDVWNKLRADVLEHYCEPLTYEALMDMKYLRFVVHESEFPHINSPICHPKLTWPNSSSSLPSHRYQQSHGQQGYRSPRRRWPRWKVAYVRQEAQCRHLQHLRDAPPKGVLRRGRRRVPTRTMGEPASRLGIPTLQRWPTNLPRSEVRLD